MKSLVLLSGLCVVVVASAASADNPDSVPGISSSGPGITPEGALAPISVVEGPGIKVGEGTVLHPIIGMETGFVSNVFHEASDEGTKGAGILRLIAQIGSGSLSPQRLRAAGESDGEQSVGTLQYRADLRLTYDVYLSGDDELQAQNGLGVGALFRGIVFPKQKFSFHYLENFQRLIRSTNFESQSQTNRDLNRLQLGVQFAPGGRAITGLLHYENVIDFFEDEDQRFANRMHNTAGLTVSWRFRPMTVFYGDASMGYFTGLGSESRKIDSYPLTLSTGIQTLLTLNTTLIARIGYTNGFYSAGPSYSAILGGIEFGYRYAHTGRITALYDYNHQDSINANFYRDHHFRLMLEQQLVPVVIHVAPEIRLRRYEGITSIIPGAPDVRDDVILAVAAGARYNFRDWFAGVVEYRLTAVMTDYMYTFGSDTDDPSFARHELVLGVRAAL